MVLSLFEHRAGLVAAVVMTAAMGGSAWREPERSGPNAVMTGGRFVYTVKRGDSLTLVSARFGVDLRQLAALNQLTPTASLRTGQALAVDNRHLIPDSAAVSIVINIPQRLLFFRDEAGAVTAYPVGLGRPTWPTFVGAFRVASLETDPVWDVPVSIQDEMRRAGKPVLTHVPAGPGNPLGAHWLGLDRAGYGIHGTNAPASIYRFQTHGCIRLHPDDVARLVASVAVGTRGLVVYEPILLSRTAEGTIWIEAHPDVYRRAPDPLAFVRRWAAAEELDAEVDWQAVAAAVRERVGAPVDVTQRPASSRRAPAL